MSDVKVSPFLRASLMRFYKNIKPSIKKVSRLEELIRKSNEEKEQIQKEIQEIVDIMNKNLPEGISSWEEVIFEYNEDSQNILNVPFEDDINSIENSDENIVNNDNTNLF